MHHPSATEHHRRLRAMEGTFIAEDKLAPSPWMPEGGTATAKTVSRMDCDDLFLVTDYQQLRDGKVTFRGHGVYGYDPDADRYSMYWFDSMTPSGFIHPARGIWDGDTLTFVSQGPNSHGRYTYRFNAAGYEFQIDSSKDGRDWQTMMTSVYRRQPQ